MRKSFLIRLQQEKLLLQKDRDSYKERLEELTAVDDEVRRHRAIIQHEKDSDAFGNGYT